MKKRIIIPLVILLVLVATFAGSVAFFSWLHEGETSNSIQMGDLTFKYTEESKIGHGINLNEGYPMSEAEGKVLEEYFDFKVESNLTRSDLVYEVEIDTTLSDIPDEGIRVYLVELVNGEEKEINSIVNLLSSYETSTDGKIIYRETIPKNTKNYTKNFRLRLWIDENIDWTDDEYIGHSGIYKVNVKANSDTSMARADVVTDRTATIERVVANDKYVFTSSSETNIDYEVTVPHTVKSIDVEVYESNTLSTSETTKLDSLEGVSTRLVNQNIKTGNNFFKTVVTASNGRNEEEYILKVVKEANPDNNLLNLGIEGYSLTPTFDKDVTSYTLTLEEDTINITGNKSAEEATVSGTGEKTLTYGENVFDIVVIAEDSSVLPKVYTITVNNERPTTPTITGGTGDNWVSTNQTISLADNNTAFAISGIDHYDVYVGSDSTAPTDATEATTTTQNTYQVTTEGVNYVYYRTVSSKGHKSVWSSPQIVRIDTTAPTCTWSGENSSWTASNKTITATCSDTGSGCTSETASKTWAYSSGTTSTANLSYTITDNVGNSATCSKTANVYVDKQAPSCSFNDSGNTSWTASNRTITATCSDTGSGCTSGTASKTWTYSSGTTSTANLSYTITDNVGNSTTCSKNGVKVYVDKQAPTCSFSGENSSWTASNKTITATCSDTGSGCTSGTASKSWAYSSGTTSTVNLSYTITDNVGNSTTCSKNGVKVYVDKQAPTCSFSGEATSWAKSRTVKATCSDTGSGCTSATASKSWSYSSGVVKTAALSYTIKDGVGNSATCSKTASIYVDAEAPTCSFSGESTSWAKSRTIKATCSDGNGSGCTSATASNSWSYSSGTIQTRALSYTIKDNVGNSATCGKTANIYVDAQAPTCVWSGESTTWTNGNRTITATCSEGDGSGCSSATSSKSWTYSSGETQTTSLSFTVKDNLGNSYTCTKTSVSVYVDKVRPRVAYSVPGSTCYSGNIDLHVASYENFNKNMKMHIYKNGTFQKEVTSTNGNIYTTLSGSGNYTVYVKAWDQAGNLSEPEYSNSGQPESRQYYTNGDGWIYRNYCIN